MNKRIAFVCVIVLLAGCGGGGSQTATTVTGTDTVSDDSVSPSTNPQGTSTSAPTELSFSCEGGLPSDVNPEALYEAASGGEWVYEGETEMDGGEFTNNDGKQFLVFVTTFDNQTAMSKTRVLSDKKVAVSGLTVITPFSPENSSYSNSTYTQFLTQFPCIGEEDVENKFAPDITVDMPSLAESLDVDVDHKVTSDNELEVTLSGDPGNASFTINVYPPDGEIYSDSVDVSNSELKNGDVTVRLEPVQMLEPKEGEYRITVTAKGELREIIYEGTFKLVDAE